MIHAIYSASSSSAGSCTSSAPVCRGLGGEGEGWRRSLFVTIVTIWAYKAKIEGK